MVTSRAFGNSKAYSLPPPYGELRSFVPSMVMSRVLHRIQDYRHSQIRMPHQVDWTDSEMPADRFQIIHVVMDAPFQL